MAAAKRRNLAEFVESIEEARVLQRIRERERGAARERARIVAWLRCEKRPAPINSARFNEWCRLADQIEAGDHARRR